jgi:hypothetical protein
MDLHQLAQELDPFMDRGGEPYIQVAVEGEAETHQIPLDSPLAGSVIRSQLAKIVKNGIPTDHQTRTAIEVIRGEAYIRARGVATCSVDHQISRKPLAQAVLAIARKGGTKKVPTALLSLLIRTAEREGIDMKKGPWPANPDALGKQLSSLIPVMEAKKVQLIRHDERPRAWSISLLIEGSGGRDGEVTDAKPAEGASSVRSDTSQAPPVPADVQFDEPRISDDQIASILDGVLS